mmetsp:Transcript_25360/g.74921  ORF Transcript_25360/g.74921 Transcript_25360/m.74921 type:complete len:204 (-) Transcript_25360:565-1176(-)
MLLGFRIGSGRYGYSIFCISGLRSMVSIICIMLELAPASLAPCDSNVLADSAAALAAVSDTSLKNADFFSPPRVGDPAVGSLTDDGSTTSTPGLPAALPLSLLLALGALLVPSALALFSTNLLPFLSDASDDGLTSTGAAVAPADAAAAANGLPAPNGAAPPGAPNGDAPPNGGIPPAPPKGDAPPLPMEPIACFIIISVMTC